MEVADVGEVIAESAAAFFKEEHNRQVIDELRAAGVAWPAAGEEKAVSAVAGKTFVLTGTFPTLSRSFRPYDPWPPRRATSTHKDPTAF